MRKPSIVQESLEPQLRLWRKERTLTTLTWRCVWLLGQSCIGVTQRTWSCVD